MLYDYKYTDSFVRLQSGREIISVAIVDFLLTWGTISEMPHLTLQREAYGESF